jgi:thiamine-monophosphate kinase
MIDISDGLAIDLSRLCKASSTGATIFEESLPILKDTEEAFERFGKDPVISSISGGEDFELLFTVDESDEVTACAAVGDAGAGITAVGRVTTGIDVCLKRIDGSEVELTGLGFDHFV